MEFYVLDRNLNKIAVVDSFVSAIWCKRYYEIGGLDLEVEASEANIAIFKLGNYIVRNDDDMVCRIEAVEIDTRGDKANTMLVGGVDCKKILTQRIIADPISHRGTIDNYIKRIVTENAINPTTTSRRIPNLEFVPNGALDDPIIQQVSYENAGEKIIALCRSFLYGWKVWIDGGKFKVGLFKGRELDLVFSPENENLYSSKFSDDETEFKNTALVGGEGEGDSRSVVWFGNESGLDRFEMFVDESMSSDGMDDIEYMTKLKTKGGEEVAKNPRKLTFEGEIDTYYNVYKQDFDIGDVVRIKNEYGITSQARITEVMETWDEDGYTVEPKLEYLEFQPITPDIVLEKKLIATITSEFDSIYRSHSGYTYLASDHPYGITVEVSGEKGEDGEDGKTNDYENTVGSQMEWTSGEGGAGGYEGYYSSLNFSVDGVIHTAKAMGGAGGGGGGGGFATADPNPDYPAGNGGKGALGDTITIDIAFTDRVVLRSLGMYGSSIPKTGTQPERTKTYYNVRLADFPTPIFPVGGDSGDGNKGSDGSGGGGNGANASPPVGSSCTLDTHRISNNGLTNKILVYTYINKNAI